MEESFRFVDDLGPAKIIHVSQPSLGPRATLVVDNVARSPSIGAGDESTERVSSTSSATSGSRRPVPT